MKKFVKMYEGKAIVQTGPQARSKLMVGSSHAKKDKTPIVAYIQLVQ